MEFSSEVDVSPSPDGFVVYLLLDVHRGWTYIGSTGDLDRRVLQHNGVYGRAQATKQTWGHCWEVAGYASGFETRTQALSFEYRWRRSCGGAQARRLRPMERRLYGLKKLVGKADGSQKWEPSTAGKLKWHPLVPVASVSSPNQSSGLEEAENGSQ